MALIIVRSWYMSGPKVSDRDFVKDYDICFLFRSNPLELQKERSFHFF